MKSNAVIGLTLLRKPFLIHHDCAKDGEFGSYLRQTEAFCMFWALPRLCNAVFLSSCRNPRLYGAYSS